MQQFNPQSSMNGSTTAVADGAPVLHCNDRFGGYVGMDVHKDTITNAVAYVGRTKAQYRGEIAHSGKAVSKLFARLSAEFDGELLLFCYEAGPTGYTLQRQIMAAGHECQVVAPSQIPHKPGERVKTDRRDALKLAQYLCAGELTAVWVPGHEQEAMRDLTRARSEPKYPSRDGVSKLDPFGATLSFWLERESGRSRKRRRSLK